MPAAAPRAGRRGPRRGRGGGPRGRAPRRTARGPGVPRRLYWTSRTRTSARARSVRELVGGDEGAHRPIQPPGREAALRGWRRGRAGARRPAPRVAAEQRPVVALRRAARPRRRPGRARPAGARRPSWRAVHMGVGPRRHRGGGRGRGTRRAGRARRAQPRRLPRPRLGGGPPAAARRTRRCSGRPRCPPGPAPRSTAAIARVETRLGVDRMSRALDRQFDAMLPEELAAVIKEAGYGFDGIPAAWAGVMGRCRPEMLGRGDGARAARQRPARPAARRRQAVRSRGTRRPAGCGW